MTEEEEIAVQEAGSEVHKFVITTWKEGEWETAWFVNPPVSTLAVGPELRDMLITRIAAAVGPRFSTYPCVC
jgi:hypothetical protein